MRGLLRVAWVARRGRCLLACRLAPLQSLQQQPFPRRRAIHIQTQTWPSSVRPLGSAPELLRGDLTCGNGAGTAFSDDRFVPASTARPLLSRHFLELTRPLTGPSSLAAKKIGKRAFASHLAAYEPRDTLYEDQVNGSKKRVRVRLRATRLEPPSEDVLLTTSLPTSTARAASYVATLQPLIV